MEDELTMMDSGAGESGKSTVLKQMKLIYAQGFSKSEKLEWKPVIFNNIVQSFRLIFDAMNDLGLKLESEDNEVSQLVQHAQPLSWETCVSRCTDKTCLGYGSR
jgi:guanine nucleotide-binding protein subunit alpha